MTDKDKPIDAKSAAESAADKAKGLKNKAKILGEKANDKVIDAAATTSETAKGAAAKAKPVADKTRGAVKKSTEHTTKKVEAVQRKARTTTNLGTRGEGATKLAEKTHLDSSTGAEAGVARYLGWILGVFAVLVLAGLLGSRCIGNDEETSEVDAASSTAETDVDVDPASASASASASLEDATAQAGGDQDTSTDGSDDTGTETEVSELGVSALAALKAAGFSNLSAEVDGENLTLTGVVDSDEDKTAAAAALDSLAGVANVDNQLIVASSDAAPAAETDPKDDATTGAASGDTATENKDEPKVTGEQEPAEAKDASPTFTG